MGKALYRKYRSKRLSEIVGQEHITTTLDNALKKGVISHAYLFTGPRGVGKTSIARILAHEVNSFDYQDNMTHLDIIEIDAASNRRIDEIRELREKVHSTPTTGKYKVYIIDEVHMLTKEAFNALLKTLEEPPAHAIFILATTEAHKLPETIVSRTQRYTFKPVDRDTARQHLRFIANQEGLKIDDEALTLIAEHGNGSFRDSISLLDQLSSSDHKVSRQDVETMLGIAPEEAIETLLKAVAEGNLPTLLATLNKLYEAGSRAAQIAKQLSMSLRKEMISDHQTLSPTKASALIRELINVPPSHEPETLLELILIEAASSGPSSTSSDDTKPDQEKPKTAKKQKISKVAVEPAAATADTVASVKKVHKKSAVKFSSEAWQEVLQEIKKHHNTLYSVAKTAQPRFEGEVLTLTFAFAFHQRRLNDAKNKDIIASFIEKVTGRRMAIVCELGDTGALPTLSEQKETLKHQTPPESLETISNIFGGAEMLE